MKSLTKRLPKPGDIVELLWAVTVWEHGVSGNHVRFPKGKTGLVVECDGVASLVLIDGQEYDIMDCDLKVLLGVKE
jgi:hypothetical protein